MYYSIFIQLLQLYSFFLFCEISLVLKFKKRRRRYKSMLRLNKKLSIYIRLKWWLITFLCLYILLLIRNLFFLLPYLNKIWLFLPTALLIFVTLLNNWVINQNPGKKIKHFCCIVAKKYINFQFEQKINHSLSLYILKFLNLRE